MKDCEYATDDSADSLLSAGVFSSDDSRLLLLLGPDNVNLVSGAPLECPGIRPLCLALDSGTEVAVGFDPLFMTTTFGVETEATVAVGVIVGGECR